MRPKSADTLAFFSASRRRVENVSLFCWAIGRVSEEFLGSRVAIPDAVEDDCGEKRLGDRPALPSSAPVRTWLRAVENVGDPGVAVHAELEHAQPQ